MITNCSLCTAEVEDDDILSCEACGEDCLCEVCHIDHVCEDDYHSDKDVCVDCGKSLSGQEDLYFCDECVVILNG